MILDMRRHTHYTSDITKYNLQKDKSYALINNWNRTGNKYILKKTSRIKSCIYSLLKMLDFMFVSKEIFENNAMRIIIHV